MFYKYHSELLGVRFLGILARTSKLSKSKTIDSSLMKCIWRDTGLNSGAINECSSSTREVKGSNPNRRNLDGPRCVAFRLLTAVTFDDGKFHPFSLYQLCENDFIKQECSILR